jgi:sugar phosphate isomerase/epimerase
VILAGKCPPEKEELEAARERGFEKVELYLEKKHLDHFPRTVENLREAELEVCSVHTPHVHLDEKAYFWLANHLARELEAYLVFHSQYMHAVHIPQLEQLEIEGRYGYENNPGASRRHLEETVLKQGHQLVLDTAHFYMAEPESYIEGIETMLDKYGDSIDLIHLCDSTTTDDGLEFESGEMDMEAVSKTIAGSGFDGILVLEVMPQFQEDARERWGQYTA